MTPNKIKLIISTALYFIVQLLYSWRIEPSGKAQIYALISAGLIAANVFFIYKLKEKMSDQFLKGYNFYLLFTTFAFYLSYCLKATLISSSPDEVITPLILELFLLATLIFNGVQIFLYSREIKKREKGKKKEKKRLGAEIFGWVDALVSAVIFVLMINLFLIQIYSIPSESMFPIFHIGDRPVVTKINRGPALPFTRFRVPPLKSIDRGDIVTFRNPKYKKTVESELKHLFSQFLYMITFTAVNLDRYDDQGREKADPLVKRVVALPGEQLQIINDRIYLRDDLNKPFVLQTENIHSQTDLYKLGQDDLSKLNRLPINSEVRTMLDRVDSLIEGEKRETLESEISTLINKSDQIRDRLNLYIPRIQRLLDSQYKIINRKNLSVTKGYLPYQKLESLRDDNIHYLYNMNDENSWNRAISFLTTHSNSEKGDFYRITNLTDLYYKKLIASWLLGNLHFLEASLTGNETALKNSQEELNGVEGDLSDFITYIVRYYDFRNLPPFPEEGLIDEKNYFLMGDNRYNSVDLRHGLNSKDRYLIKGDKFSLVYKSYLSPMSIDEKWIEGFAGFRLFPLGRMGLTN